MRRLIQIHKKRIKKEDSHYLVYYTFTEEEKGGRDVRAEMESHPNTMEYNRSRFYNISYSTFSNFLSFPKIIY